MTTPHDSTAEDLAEISPLGTDEAPPVLNTTPCADPEAYCVPRSPIENVLLIDGDNDPHVPPDARVTRATLVRVFLRPGALLPRNLEKPLAHLPNFCTVTSPKGGANAADFVMSLHAGMLHAVLPSHVPFLMVTNDATLSAMAAELQRLGRVATIWTSNSDAATMSRKRPTATSPLAPSPPAQPRTRWTPRGRALARRKFSRRFVAARSYRRRCSCRSRGGHGRSFTGGAETPCRQLAARQRRASQDRRQDAVRGRRIRPAPSAHQGHPRA